MSEEVKTSDPITTDVKPETTATTTTKVEEKKSGSAMPKIIIILVVLLCLCVVCAGAAWVVFTQVLNRASDTLNSSFTNTVLNSMYNTSNDSNTEGDTYTFNSSDGTGSFSVGTSLPSNFPSDIPIYSGATASFSASDVNDQGKETSSVTFALKANLNDVVAFYKTKMETAGYELKSEVNIFGNILEYENSQREVLISVLGSTEAGEDMILTISSTAK